MYFRYLSNVFFVFTMSSQVVNLKPVTALEIVGPGSMEPDNEVDYSLMQ